MSTKPATRINNIKNHLVPENKAWSRICTTECGKAVPIKVCITGAAGQIAYSLIFMVSSGRMFGPYQPVEIILLDIPKMAEMLKGVIMEIEDCAFPLVLGVTAASSPVEAFRGVEVVLMLGAFPRGPGMERKDLLKINVNIFKEQGEALDKYASRDVKVVVVGNPANTNCLTLMANAPTLPRTAFSALTRLDQNRAVAQISSKLGVHVSKVNNVIIWGNHSNTQFPDVTHATVSDFPAPSISTPVRGSIDDTWIQTVFTPKVQQRGAEVIKVRKASSAVSAATAVVDHMRSWLLGTRYHNGVVSMAVASDGAYGIPEGLIFSFPVVCSQGEYKIVKGLVWDSFSKQMIEKTTQELLEERDLALSFLKAK